MESTSRPLPDPHIQFKFFGQRLSLFFFVYNFRKPEPISDGCELRNRKSGQRVSKVAKQQVLTLDHDVDDFVIGAVATNQTLFISTQKALFSLKIQ